MDSARDLREPGLIRSGVDRTWFLFDRVVRDLPRPWRWRVRLPRLGLFRRLGRWRSHPFAVRNLLIVVGVVVVMVGIDALGRSAGV